MMRPTAGPWNADEIHPKAACVYINSPENSTGDVAVLYAAGQIDHAVVDAAFIVAACNACQQVNPKNPHAVAEALPDLVKAFNGIIARANNLKTAHPEMRDVIEAVVHYDYDRDGRILAALGTEESR